MLQEDNILDTIQKLIHAGHLIEAKELADEYLLIVPENLDLLSTQVVLAFLQSDLKAAENFLEKGLAINPENPDLLFNKAYLLEQKGDLASAFSLYTTLEQIECENEDFRREIYIAKERLENILEENCFHGKLALFVKPEMDSFLGPVEESLKQFYEIRKVQPKNLQEIEAAMKWADTCWFEWCDELLIEASKLPIASQRKVICRLHSYEAFTDYPAQVKWENVDYLICVAKHIRDFVVANFSVKLEQTTIIPNAINLEKWSFRQRGPGFNIAYVGYINYKKGPMLLLHAFYSLYQLDHRYKLYIAGQFQDHRDVLYFEQMVKELSLEKSVIFTGWQDDLDSWLEDKNYILCTSILESQNMSVMQAMAKGIKPLIHNFVGARGIYRHEDVWNTLDELQRMTKTDYISSSYRNFIAENYNSLQLNQQIQAAVGTCTSIKRKINNKKPLVTIGITVYNGKKYLKQCLDSVLRQTYPNIEVLVIDNCSTDGSQGIIRKYERKYKNVKGIFHKVNSGGPVQGIKEIQLLGHGEYYQWLCYDDCLEQDAIERFVEYLNEHPEMDYVYSDFNIIDENSNKTSEWNYEVKSPEAVIEHVFKTGSGVIPMFGMQRKSFLIENNLEWYMPENDFQDFSSDTLTQVYLIRFGWKYGLIDKPVINYRIHSTNESHNLEKRIKASIYIYERIIEWYSEEIYFPEISWGAIPNRSQYKDFGIALFYFEQVNKYFNGLGTPYYLKVNVTQEQLCKYCFMFIKQGMKYINSALKRGTEYQSEILKLKEQYDNLITEWQQKKFI
ncbi:MAG: glycosyltransferase [Sporomusaceae bacterium]|nr:glycosyltransferase [Sporomusaceae bacterium]